MQLPYLTIPYLKASNTTAIYRLKMQTLSSVIVLQQSINWKIKRSSVIRCCFPIQAAQAACSSHCIWTALRERKLTLLITAAGSGTPKPASTLDLHDCTNRLQINRWPRAIHNAQCTAERCQRARSGSPVGSITKDGNTGMETGQGVKLGEINTNYCSTYTAPVFFW